MTVASMTLAVRSALLLAGRGRPRRGPRPSLVIAGPYRRTRNPVWLGVLGMLVGTTMATGSRAIAFVTIIAALAAHAWVVLVEEPRLADRFGPAYQAYLRRVPRWVPRLDGFADEA